MEVKLVTYTPDPLKTLTKATLTSYWDEWNIENIEKITKKDAEIHIPRVLSYGHESILEHINLTFAIEGISIVTLKQITRHRLMSFTVRSQRYIELDENEGYVIPDSIKGKYVSEIIDTEEMFGENIEVVHNFEKEFKMLMRRAFWLYKKMVENGIPREDARFVLPQAVTTSMTVTMNMREFKHFMGLRMCQRAQWEIRELAWKMWEEVVKVEELKKILIWAKVAPRCIQLGYCPERELMPEGCYIKQKEWWKKVESGE